MTQRITKKVIEQIQEYLKNTYNKDIYIAKNPYSVFFGTKNNGGFAPFLVLHRGRYHYCSRFKWVNPTYAREEVLKALDLIM